LIADVKPIYCIGFYKNLSNLAQLLSSTEQFSGKFSLVLTIIGVNTKGVPHHIENTDNNFLHRETLILKELI
jgi:hypothetical protein